MTGNSQSLYVLGEKADYDHKNLMLELYIDIKINMGVPLSNKLPRTVFRIDDDRPPVDYFKSGGKQVISPRAKNLFDRFDVNAEYFPVQMNFPRSNLGSQDYFIMNPLCVLDCVDEEQSIIRRSKPNGVVSRIDKLVLKHAELEPDLFLLKRYTYITCITAGLADGLRSMGATNVRLRTVEEYSL